MDPYEGTSEAEGECEWEEDGADEDEVTDC